MFVKLVYGICDSYYLPIAGNYFTHRPAVDIIAAPENDIIRSIVNTVLLIADIM